MSLVEPPALVTAKVTAKTELQKSRHISLQLEKTYAKLKREVEPELEPEQEKPDPDLERSLELACLGLEVAMSKRKTIGLERDVLEKERAAGLVSSAGFKKRSETLDKRQISAGDEYWRNHKEKVNLAGTGVIKFSTEMPSTKYRTEDIGGNNICSPSPNRHFLRIDRDKYNKISVKPSLNNGRQAQ